MRHSRLFNVTFGVAFCAALSAIAHEGPPPPARPGQCFGRTVRSPITRSWVRRVLVSPARATLRSLPAVYANDTRRVLVRPIRVERTRIPALYGTVAHVSYLPGPGRWVRTPAEWRMERRTVLLAPAHAEWRPQAPHYAYGDAAPGQTIVQPTGRILCRVWCPARYGVAEQRVMLSRGGWVRVPGQARRVIDRERVLLRPARTLERRTPAVYRYERTAHLVRPARTERVLTAPLYRAVVERRAYGGSSGWSQVLCSGPLSPEFQARLQGSLNAHGYDAGPADGRQRPETYQALRRFQQDRHMPEGQVTVESAEALGVLPR